MKILLCLFVLFTFPFVANAQVISEIMYDVPGTDSKREWIEIYNNSSSSIDVTSLKLQENDINHTIKAIDAISLPNDYYAVIADNPEQFLLDNPNFEGILFDSAFSLNNNGESIGLVSGSSVIDSVTYTSNLGAKGDGNSLQLHEDFFVPGKPTPGAENTNEAITPKEDNEDSSEINSDISTHDSHIELSDEDPDRLIKIGAGRERLVATNAPVFFTAIENSKNKKRTRFSWIFGDGKIKRGKEVSHSYKYPGLYNVVLQARNGKTYAVARTKVNVFELDLDLRFGTTTEKTVLILENKGETEVNVGRFKIKSENHDFIFPRDTIVSSDSKIILDEKLLDFPLSMSEASLLLPNGDVLQTASFPQYLEESI